MPTTLGTTIGVVDTVGQGDGAGAVLDDPVADGDGDGNGAGDFVAGDGLPEGGGEPVGAAVPDGDGEGEGDWHGAGKGIATESVIVLAWSACSPAGGSCPTTVPGVWSENWSRVATWNPVCSSVEVASVAGSPITDGTRSGW